MVGVGYRLFSNRFHRYRRHSLRLCRSPSRRRQRHDRCRRCYRETMATTSATSTSDRFLGNPRHLRPQKQVTQKQESKTRTRYNRPILHPLLGE